MNATPDSTDADVVFDALVERLSGRLALFLTQLVRDRELTQDLLQDTLLAYTSREQLDEESSHEAWLFGIARNRALNATRPRQRERRTVERLLLNRREADCKRQPRRREAVGPGWYPRPRDAERSRHGHRGDRPGARVERFQ